MSEPTLFDRLRDSDLLTGEQLAELRSLPEAKDSDPKVLGRVLLQRGWLTRFQISMAASGKGKELSIGAYRLLDKLGEGGMGQVFKARHKHMNRLVALKLMRKEKLSSVNSVQRFYQEVQAAAALVHPNIALAFDAGQAGSSHFFSMEFVDGPDLARLVREKGPLPVTQACDFIRQAALGLQHAHERGLVHRDVKPSNLLVSSEGGKPTVKILDLGLARLGDSFQKERGLTKMGQVIGTPDYLAPEQALDAHNVDTRADVYSLGCSLFFLLAGRAPYQAESLAELLLKHQMDPTPSVRKHRSDVPAALDELLQGMMAKKPADRPSTPGAVAEALAPFARGEDGEAEPLRFTPAAPDRTWSGLTDDGDGPDLVKRPAKRTSRDRSSDTLAEEESPARKKGKQKKPEKTSHLPLILGAAGGGVVLLIGLIVGAIFLFRSGSPQPSPQVGLTETDKNKSKPAEKKDKGNEKPDNALPPEEPAVALEGVNARFTGHGAKVAALAVSPDGRFAASGDADGVVLMWNLALRKPDKRLGKLPGPVTALAFTADNHLLATARNKLHEWDLVSGNKIGKERPGAWLMPASGLSITEEPVENHSMLQIRRLATGEGTSAVSLGWGAVLDVAASHSGQVAYVLCEKMMIVIDLTGPQVVKSLNNETGPKQVTAICGVSRDEVLTGERNGTVRMLSTAGKENRLVRRLSTSPVTSLAMSRDDGARVLIGGEDGAVTLLESGGTGNVNRFMGHIGAVRRVCFCPDGKHFLSAGDDRTVWFCDMTQGRTSRARMLPGCN
jgi:serine/threonine protein kinase/WD40 repeat protein